MTRQTEGDADSELKSFAEGDEEGMLGDEVGFFGFFVFFGAGVLDLVGAGVLTLVGAGVLTLVGAEVLTLVGARVLTAIAKPRPPTPPPFID